jgi:hypothetical protein
MSAQPAAAQHFLPLLPRPLKPQTNRLPQPARPHPLHPANAPLQPPSSTPPVPPNPTPPPGRRRHPRPHDGPGAHEGVQPGAGDVRGAGRGRQDAGHGVRAAGGAPCLPPVACSGVARAFACQWLAPVSRAPCLPPVACSGFKCPLFASGLLRFQMPLACQWLAPVSRPGCGRQLERGLKARLGACTGSNRRGLTGSAGAWAGGWLRACGLAAADAAAARPL